MSEILEHLPNVHCSMSFDIKQFSFGCQIIVLFLPIQCLHLDKTWYNESPGQEDFNKMSQQKFMKCLKVEELSEWFIYNREVI